jgi:hypothetical protein
MENYLAVQKVVQKAASMAVRTAHHLVVHLVDY